MPIRIVVANRNGNTHPLESAFATSVVYIHAKFEVMLFSKYFITVVVGQESCVYSMSCLKPVLALFLSLI